MNPAPDSAALLDSFRRDRARGVNDDIDLTLRPVYRNLLAKLGDPHQNLPPVFHVAGTNGKGSTCAFLRSMLEAAGYSVHVYTSPHLVRFHERIRIAGELISEAELAELLAQCRKFAAADSITYFEAATAVAFAAFARYHADFAILEVGLGGRLDATNIIPKPLASLITRLSMDHRDYLGDSMKKIGQEKAGIMRTGIPCFAAAQPDKNALQALRDAAIAVRAPLYVAGEDWQIAKNKNGFRYSDKAAGLDFPPPALRGDHQYDNAGLAIAALLGSGFKGGRDALAKGLRRVEWPGRLQPINRGKFADLLPKPCELWLDGGHNDSAGEALAKQAAEWKNEDALPLHIICGMLTTKKPAEFLAPLQPYAAGIQTVAIPDEVGSFTAEVLAAEAAACGLANVRPELNVESAIRNLAVNLSQPARVLICGSLYLAGHVLQKNNS